jgi:DnaJ-class molecular chaperone
MPDFTPTRPEGAQIHECARCGGEGWTADDAVCPDCDGTGEWFE